MSRPAELVYHFGALRLYPSKRLLLDGELHVRLGDRALDLLIALVERAGEVVPKEELFKRVWPRTVVEETSLRVHIAALRKALGDGRDNKRFIANVPGQGYSFICPVAAHQVERTLEKPAVMEQARQVPFPTRLTRMIGRSSSVNSITKGLADYRCVTITGEGGVGKTTLALSVAENSTQNYPDGVAFVDLAAIASPTPLISTVARALGLTLSADAPMQSLMDLIAHRQTLVILDNCEHLADSVAELVVQLLKSTSRLHILATSREPLRAEGERIHRLEALRVPPRTGVSGAQEAMQFESVQLLVERIGSTLGMFELSDSEALCAAELCRRLDGIPLAIELAAARVSFFGMQGLLSRLDNRLSLLTSGLRTALPRHQTLRALYDWSYDLLDTTSRHALDSLSVFAGAFTLEGALAVIPGGERARSLSIFLELIAKSLVVADLGRDERRYRLLDSTRVYAAEKLREAGGHDHAHSLHASHLIHVLKAANADWEPHARLAWLNRHAPLIDDVNLALDWAEAAAPLVGAQLCAVSFQLAQQLSQLERHRLRIERALAGLARLPERHLDLEHQLTAILGVALGHARAHGPHHDEWLKAAADVTNQAGAGLEMLYGSVVSHFTHGEYRQALAAATRLESICDSNQDTQGRVISHRMQAQLWHFLGDQPRARQLAHEVMNYPAVALRLGGKMLDPLDRHVSMRIVLARIHWLEGDAEGADRCVNEALELMVSETDYARCHVLALAACPIAFWRGDLASATSHLANLRQLSEQHAIELWKEWVSGYEWLLEGASGPAPTASIKLLDMMGTLAPVMADQRLLARAESGEVGWCAAELLRAHGEHLLALSDGHAEEAEHLFERALAMSRRQGLLRWELRAAVSLTRHLMSQQRPHVSAEPLLRVLPRLGQHPSCPAHQAAMDLLEELSPPSDHAGVAVG